MLSPSRYSSPNRAALDSASSFGALQNPAREREEEVFKIQQERERKGREDVDVDEVDDDEKEERRTRIWWRREEGEENELGSDEKTKK